MVILSELVVVIVGLHQEQAIEETNDDNLFSPHVGIFPECEDHTAIHQRVKAFSFNPAKMPLVLPSLCHTGKKKRKFLQE